MSPVIQAAEACCAMAQEIATAAAIADLRVVMFLVFMSINPINLRPHQDALAGSDD
jgi:hypothetical protein